MKKSYILEYDDYYELYKILYKKKHHHILSHPGNPDSYNYDVLCSYEDIIKFFRLFQKYPEFDWTMKLSGIGPNNHDGWLHNENGKIVLFDALAKDAIKLDSDAIVHVLYALDILGTTLLKNYFTEKNVDFNSVFLKYVTKFPDYMHRQYVHFLMEKDINISDDQKAFESIFNYFIDSDYCAAKLAFLEIISDNVQSLDIDKCAVFLAKFMNRHESISSMSMKRYLLIQKVFSEYDLCHLHSDYPVLKKLDNYNNISTINQGECLTYGIDTNLIAYQSVLRHDDVKTLYSEIHKFLANVVADHCSDYIYSHEEMKKAKFVFIFNDSHCYLKNVLVMFLENIEQQLQQKVVLNKKDLKPLWEKLCLYRELDNSLDKYDNKKTIIKNKI